MPSTRAQSRTSSHARPRSEIFSHDPAQNTQPASSRVLESRSSRQQTPEDQHPEIGSGDSKSTAGPYKVQNLDGHNQGLGHSKTDKSSKPSSKEIPRTKTYEKIEETRRHSKSDLGKSEQHGQSYESGISADESTNGRRTYEQKKQKEKDVILLPSVSISRIADTNQVFVQEIINLKFKIISLVKQYDEMTKYCNSLSKEYKLTYSTLSDNIQNSSNNLFTSIESIVLTQSRMEHEIEQVHTKILENITRVNNEYIHTINNVIDDKLIQLENSLKKQIELGLLGSSKGRIQLVVLMNLHLKFRNKERTKEIQDLSQSLDMTNDDSRENRREPTRQ
ncbi:hypothetical protein PPACK8108_LOCUS17251 [Phakopsora pachyrhizi]|uniref:Uncharacterized protein n=1 Tax=Phakopsora pachyrhizi TaxID=170000 RepID=A0AAV0AV67_PHAPC|nr:hypothetical protein PPACK8108_LOCUS8740 [Phakopsora pachyrhizi]CAH7683607.1 hypothetical protein PPACK8108_LOCUS17251 [Phakopsora pachyrhizi]